MTKFKRIMDSEWYDLWSTSHGNGIVIKRNYKLKKEVTGWIQAMRFADQDFQIILPAGTVVDVVLLHDDDSFSVVKTAKLKDFGFKIFCEKEVKFESDTYKITKL